VPTNSQGLLWENIWILKIKRKKIKIKKCQEQAQTLLIYAQINTSFVFVYKQFFTLGRSLQFFEQNRNYMFSLFIAYRSRSCVKSTVGSNQRLAAFLLSTQH
jgi:hypothetical protein